MKQVIERAGFKPPTIQQVRAYFAGQSAHNWADSFFERYQANGWTVNTPPTAASGWSTGRKPMTNWKNAATKWIEKQRTELKNRTYRQ